MNKLFKLLFIVAIITSVFACGSDDDATPTPTSSGDNPFVGTWELAAVEVDIDQTSTVGGQAIVTQTEITGSNMAYTLIFTEDTYSVSGGYDLTVNAIVSGTSVWPQTSSLTNIEQSGTYTYDESTITVSGGLINVDVNGDATTVTGNMDAANYTIDSNGVLNFIEMSTESENLSGISVVSTTDSQSRWVKQ